MNVWLPIACILIAIIIDLVSYWRMPGALKKGYYPNLPLLGIGLLVGLSIDFISMLGKVIEEVKTALSNPPNNIFALVGNLTFIYVPGVLLGVAIWAIAKVCHRE